MLLFPQLHLSFLSIALKRMGFPSITVCTQCNCWLWCYYWFFPRLHFSPLSFFHVAVYFSLLSTMLYLEFVLVLCSTKGVTELSHCRQLWWVDLVQQLSPDPAACSLPPWWDKVENQNGKSEENPMHWEKDSLVSEAELCVPSWGQGRQ